MNLIKSLPQVLSSVTMALVLSIFAGATAVFGQNNAPPPLPVLQINAGQVTAKVSPTLYGLMTEEINYAYEGGLYGELIRNRSFMASTNEAKYWNAIGNGLITLDSKQPLNAALNVSLKLDTSKASKNSPAGLANSGYWGIPLRPNTTYRASFFAKGEGFSGSLKVSLESKVNTNEVAVSVRTAESAKAKSGKFDWYLGEFKLIAASAEIPKISKDWQKYEVTLTTGNIAPSKDGQLVISTTKPGTFWNKHGTVWFSQVSLFPPTYHNRTNGSRSDLMQLMADMQPKFLRFPGGNYLEGDYFNERFDWKKTVGDLAQRPGHRSPWNYWSTDGFGLPEFLGWCEDLKMEPVLAVFAGYALKRDYVNAGPELEPYVQEALEEIEYVAGDASTKWGAQRIKDGHPAPLALKYVEVGNEDWFDRSGSYDARFAQFYDAIKAKYPQLQIIATTKVKSRVPDLLDEHYYRSQEEMEMHAHDYDSYSRTNHTKIFCGEWATRVGSPTPNMAGALGDAAWMTGMERNSDIVLMHCYAPLFVNVNPGGMQWETDLIGYDALNSYGSPAYYAQKMFSTLLGNEVLATAGQNIPTRLRQPAQEVPSLFYVATRDRESGTIYLKVVNPLGTEQAVKIEISGVASVAAGGSATVLQASSPDDTNSIQEPKKIVPVTEKANGLGTNFTRTFPPYSITVLELKAK